MWRAPSRWRRKGVNGIGVDSDSNSDSWDHAENGSCTVTVRDDGSPVEGVGEAGTGLARLSRRVEGTGGTLDVGPSPDGGWEVRAVIPRRDSAADTEEVDNV